MEDRNNHKHSEIDAILSGIFKELSLRERFEKRLFELNVSQRAVQKMLKMERRTLNGIIDGTQKKVDTWSLQKVAVFLDMPMDEFVEIHSSMTENNFLNQNTSANKKKFLKENFDLAVLRKAGIINDISNFEEIEKSLISFLGLSSIFDYKKGSFNAAFWAGTPNDKTVEKTETVRYFWLTMAKTLVAKIDNPHHYDRQNLVRYFPQIRRNSTVEEFGLLNVIKNLFKLGVTVIYQPKLSYLKLRGATFEYDNKPCIVLTDYRGYYSTLWHCLIHELYHVLFDLSVVRTQPGGFHVSDDREELFTEDEREVEADTFARKYLFSTEKMEEVKDCIYDYKYIQEVAKNNNVHSSIIYSYHAFDQQKHDRLVWMRAKRYIPEASIAIYKLTKPWEETKSLEDVAKKLRFEIYNS